MKTLKQLLQMLNMGELATTAIILTIKEWLEQKRQEAIENQMMNYTLCITELIDELLEELKE